MRMELSLAGRGRLLLQLLLFPHLFSPAASSATAARLIVVQSTGPASSVVAAPAVPAGGGDAPSHCKHRREIQILLSLFTQRRRIPE